MVNTHKCIPTGPYQIDIYRTHKVALLEAHLIEQRSPVHKVPGYSTLVFAIVEMADVQDCFLTTRGKIRVGRRDHVRVSPSSEVERDCVLHMS